MTKAGKELADRLQMLERQILALEIVDESDFQVIVYRIASLLMRLTLRKKL